MDRFSPFLWLFFLGFACGCGSNATRPSPAPVPPPAVTDPIDTKKQALEDTKKKLDDAKRKKEAEELEVAIAPYVAKGRESYPGAKKRYHDGLPPGYSFIVVTQLRDDSGATERAYIVVGGIADGKIKGRIESNIATITGYKTGDVVAFPESDLLDWIIRHPNGSEEGNVVGNFLDSRK